MKIGTPSEMGHVIKGRDAFAKAFVAEPGPRLVGEQSKPDSGVASRPIYPAGNSRPVRMR